MMFAETSGAVRNEHQDGLVLPPKRRTGGVIVAVRFRRSTHPRSAAKRDDGNAQTMLEKYRRNAMRRRVKEAGRRGEGKGMCR